MRYLITGDFEPFFTKWYEYENHYAEGMIIYDLKDNVYSTDGKTWQEIQFDHL
jgi:hypothetical protein